MDIFNILSKLPNLTALTFEQIILPVNEENVSMCNVLANAVNSCVCSRGVRLSKNVVSQLLPIIAYKVSRLID